MTDTAQSAKQDAIPAPTITLDSLPSGEDLGASSWREGIKKEIATILHFTMLAASTVGPGTVIVCSKSGADYGLKLIWALVLASWIAYTLQEGSARLAIVSRFSLGQAMRFHFKRSMKAFNIPIICGVVAVGIVVGNAAYEANNFVGAIEATYALTMPKTLLSRILMHALFGSMCCITLFVGAADKLSQGLGVVVLVMVGLFSISASLIGVNGEEFGRGLVPYIPPGASVIALSMVATTAIPFNCFLASSAAEGYDLRSMRRGIMFSTLMAAILSILIVITGTGIDKKDDEEFTVQDITTTLKDTQGRTAGFGFGAGLFAAAFSSALTVALGAALTVQSIAAPMPLVTPGNSIPKSTARELSKLNQGDVHGLLTPDPDTVDPKISGPWAEDGWRFRGVIILLSLFSFLVGASGVSTVSVVLTAQVVNGLLLPCIATCLIVCLNNDKIMCSAPTTMTDNLWYLGVVAATLFLASNTVVGFFTKDETTMTIASAVMMLLILIPIILYIRSLHTKKGQQHTFATRDSDDSTKNSTGPDNNLL